MLRVRLREHHELDVGRIALQRRELLREIVDLVARQREAELGVGALERGTPAREHVDGAHGPRRMRGEQQLFARRLRQQRFRHSIVQQRRDAQAVGIREHGAHGELVDATALDPVHRKRAGPRDVGGLRGPRRDRAEPRHDVELLPAGRSRGRAAAVVEQRP